MKINDVLNCVNNTLEDERRAKGLPPKLGHFIYRIGVEKGMGHIKMFHAYIEFFNMKTGASYRVIAIHHTMPCKVEELEEAKEQVALMTLKNFFIALRLGANKGAYENYVTGEFQGWT